MQGAIEKSNVRSVIEMTRMIEVTRTYTQIASILQQQSDLRRTAIEQARRSPDELSVRRMNQCEHFTPPRPE